MKKVIGINHPDQKKRDYATNIMLKKDGFTTASQDIYNGIKDYVLPINHNIFSVNVRLISECRTIQDITLLIDLFNQYYDSHRDIKPDVLGELCNLFTIFKGRLLMTFQGMNFFSLTKINHCRRIDEGIFHIDLLTP